MDNNKIRETNNHNSFHPYNKPISVPKSNMYYLILLIIVSRVERRKLGDGLPLELSIYMFMYCFSIDILILYLLLCTQIILYFYARYISSPSL